MAARLVVLDRDGVINEDSALHIRSPSDWRPIPGSMRAIGLLTRAGITVSVATNQSGIGRGLFDRRALYAINRKLRRHAAREGGRIGRIAYCPHTPDDGCTCRKPEPALLYTLAAHAGTTTNEVCVVGDSERDIDAALAAGSRAVLVRTGNGRRTEERLAMRGTRIEVHDDLLAFARAFVSDRSTRR